MDIIFEKSNTNHTFYIANNHFLNLFNMTIINKKLQIKWDVNSRRSKIKKMTEKRIILQQVIKENNILHQTAISYS